jgi:uncharacterized membrane protein YeaQ/YmgE (transglycosylase-associated protein family)
MKMKYKKENRNKIIAVVILGIIGISLGAFVLSPLGPMERGAPGDWYQPDVPYYGSPVYTPPPDPLADPPLLPGETAEDREKAPVAPVLRDIAPAVSKDGIISVVWNAVPGALSYKVYRQTGYGYFDVIKDTRSTRISDSIFESGEYKYYVVAVNDRGDSIRSNVEIVEVDTYIPAEEPAIEEPIPPIPEEPDVITGVPGLSDETIIGISVAIVMSVIGVIAVVFVMRRRKR